MVTEADDAVSLIKWSEETSGVRIGLPGDLDLAMAGPLTDALRHALGLGKPVLVAADQVLRIGSAPVQALLAATREAERRGMPFVILKPSEVVVETCADLGLSAWLEKWSEM